MDEIVILNLRAKSSSLILLVSPVLGPTTTVTFWLCHQPPINVNGRFAVDIIMCAKQWPLALSSSCHVNAGDVALFSLHSPLVALLTDWLTDHYPPRQTNSTRWLMDYLRGRWLRRKQCSFRWMEGEMVMLIIIILLLVFVSEENERDNIVTRKER